MAKERPKILAFAVVKKDSGLFLICTFGDREVEKEIPPQESLVRFSAIFDAAGDLADTEIVTSK